jgi:hypothetical protein
MAEGLCRTRPDVASLRSRLNVCLSARTTPTVSWRGNTGPRPAKFLGALENTAPQISCTLSLARFRERQALDTHVLSSVVRTRSLQPCSKLRPSRGAGTRSSRPTVGAVPPEVMVPFGREDLRRLRATLPVQIRGRGQCCVTCGAQLVDGVALGGHVTDVPSQVQCPFAGFETELFLDRTVELIELPQSSDSVAALGVMLDQSEVGGLVCGVSGQ